MEKMPHEYVTPAAAASERKMAKAGFTTTRIVFSYDDDPEAGVLIFMSRRRRHALHLGTIEPDGLINGESPANFLSHF